MDSSHQGAHEPVNALSRPSFPFAANPESQGDSATPGRAMPANLEAEAAFLGAVLIDNRVVEELSTPLAATHFFEPVHQRLYERMLQLIDRKAVVTPVTLRPISRPMRR
jgi:replicative DNA helicase